MIKKIVAFTTNPYTWVQWCHFSLAYLAVMLTYLFLGNIYVAIAFIVPFTAWKELWFDPREEHTGRMDWDDFAFYTAGWIAARLTLFLPHHR